MNKLFQFTVMNYHYIYQEYTEKYVQGASKISQRTCKPQVSIKNDAEYIFKHDIIRNYDLYFSKQGKLVTTYNLHYHSDTGNLLNYTRYTYTYSEDGLPLIVKTFYTRQWSRNEEYLRLGIPNYLTIFFYDKEKRIKKEVSFMGIKLYSEVEYEYENNYIKIEETYADDDKVKKDITVEWLNEKGKVIEEEETRIYIDSNKPKLQARTKYVYDENMMLEYEDTYDVEKGQRRFQHNIWKTVYEEYDERGHWIKKTELRDNEPIRITERTIEYY